MTARGAAWPGALRRTSAADTLPKPPTLTPCHRTLVLPALCGVLLLSGAAGLVYQVAWIRLLGLAFGVTIYAISTVLAAFMGGLALGSALGGRLADRVRRPLRAYGLAEIGIGVAALATPMAFPWLQEVYQGLALVADPGQAPLLAGTVRVLLAVALLLVPTALMGATLPLAVRGARRRGADVAADGRHMGLLYALNTAGAVAGTLAAGFVLIGRLGVSGTIAVAVLLNLEAGVGALLLSRWFEPATAPVSAVPAPAAGTAGSEPVSPTLARVAFVAFGVSGALSLAYEVVWSRVLAVLFDSTIYGFVLMLATVLLGIAAGSAAAGWLVGRRPAARFAGLAFGWLEVGIGVAAVLPLVAFGGAYDLLLALREGGSPLFARLLRTDVQLMALLSVATVLPAALLMGATFPAAARLWAAGAGRLGTRLGGVYAANVVGAILGSLGAGFVLLPLAGAHAALLVLAAANVLLGVALLVAAGSRSVPAIAGAAGLALLAWGAGRPPVHEQVFRQRFPDQQLLWYREGLENTVSVGRSPDDVRRLYTNALSQTNDTPDLVRYLRVVGHLAALLAPADGPERRVLVVGLGGGATPGAIARHGGTRVDVVELSEAVVAAAPAFRHVSAGLLDRPNVSLTIDDGRNWLLRSRRPYDIITADIVPPFHAGAANLYSVEYFRLAARALAPGGVMVQWVSPENAFAHTAIVRTFLEAFPHATLWLAGDLLIGSPGPLRVDAARLEERLADPAARAALAEVGLNRPQDVLTHFRADAAELRAYAGPGPLLTDDRPLLEYFRALDLPTGPADLERFSGDVRKVLAEGSSGRAAPGSGGGG